MDIPKLEPIRTRGSRPRRAHAPAAIAAAPPIVAPDRRLSGGRDAIAGAARHD
ncbi:hypothetical protein [Lysobacter enzymogenes]|uniref:hypothetical protein n=1 Tax=Lysobacter enzymogenes TaxID=69 RepID=UPI0014413F5E|nr:hypothetical protein [Lysobacter enzymogenes]